VIRVLLGYRGALVRGALAAVLSRERDLAVVAELASAADVRSAVSRTRPDVAIVDPDLAGGVDVDELCRTVATLGILVLMDRQSDPGVNLLLARLAPRVGLIATDASVDELIGAVRQLAHGQPVLDVELAVAALRVSDNPLTEREREVLRLVRTGATTKEIAATLFLSTRTVRNYLSHVMAKTGARTQIEAIHIAQDAGWI
jgi:two-component system, NarL family, response regulator DesR